MALNAVQSRPGQLDYGRFALWGIFGLVAILFAGFLGLVSGTGNILFAGIFGGMIAAAIVAFMPVVLLWVALIGGLVVAGTVRLYFPEYQFIRWLVAGAATLLILHVAADFFRPRRSRQMSISPVVYLVLAFICISLISTLLVNHGGLGAIAGAKNYFQVVAVLFVMALVRWDEKTMLALPKVMFWIALLQLPLALHQFLYIVPTRVGLSFGIVPADVVAGTFGADRRGGGANAILALFLIAVWTGVLARWKYGLLGTVKLLVLSTVLLMPIFLNESKVSVVYLMLALGLLFHDTMLRHPLRFIVGSIAFVLLVLGLLTSYALLKPSGKAGDVATVVENSLESNFGDRRTHYSKELNRYSVYPFWLQQHRAGNVAKMLLGHGLGESKESEGTFGIATLASKHYQGVGIGLTGFSSLLWDVGLLGTALVVSLFVWAYREAARLARAAAGNPPMQALFRALQAIVPIVFLSLAHKNFYVFDLPFQTFVWGLLGYLAYWSRRYRDAGIHFLPSSPSRT